MKNYDYVSLREIVVSLERLCNQGETGTMFVGTVKNQFAQIAINKGKIRYVLFNGVYGITALELLAKQDKGRFNFRRDVMTQKSDSLPGNSEIYQILRGNTKLDNIEQLSLEIEAAISLKYRNIFKVVLSKYIGPAAAYISKDHCNSNSTLQGAIQAMVGEIPSALEARKFREEIFRELVKS